MIFFFLPHWQGLSWFKHKTYFIPSDQINKIFSCVITNSHAGGYESDPSTPMVYSCSRQYRIHTHGVFRGLQVSISRSQLIPVHSQDTLRFFVLLGCAHIGPRSGHGVQRHTDKPLTHIPLSKGWLYNLLKWSIIQKEMKNQRFRSVTQCFK